VGIGSMNNDIVTNTIVDAWHGVYLFGTGGNTVTGNTIVRPVKVGVVDNLSAGGNVITNNTINQAPIGMFSVSAAGDQINPNTYFSTTVLTTIADPGKQPLPEQLDPAKPAPYEKKGRPLRTPPLFFRSAGLNQFVATVSSGLPRDPFARSPSKSK